MNLGRFYIRNLLLTPIHMIGEQKSRLFSELHLNGLRLLKIFEKTFQPKLKRGNGIHTGEKLDYIIWCVIGKTGVFLDNVLGVYQFKIFMKKMERQLLHMKRLNMFHSYVVNKVRIFSMSVKQKNYYQNDLLQNTVRIIRLPKK